MRCAPKGQSRYSVNAILSAKHAGSSEKWPNLGDLEKTTT